MYALPGGKRGPAMGGTFLNETSPSVDAEK